MSVGPCLLSNCRHGDVTAAARVGLSICSARVFFGTTCSCVCVNGEEGGDELQFYENKWRGGENGAFERRVFEKFSLSLPSFYSNSLRPTDARQHTP